MRCPNQPFTRLTNTRSPPSDLAIQAARAALNLPALPAGNAATTATPSAQSAQLSAPAVGNPAPTASTLESLSLSDDDVIAITVPRALFETRTAELARLGIYERMTHTT